MSLDLVLAALRHAYHTCFYCAVTTDHQEELQRKCIQHLRKPLSKATYDEFKAKMAEDFTKVNEESSMQDDGDLKSKRGQDQPQGERRPPVLRQRPGHQHQHDEAERTLQLKPGHEENR